MSRSLVIGIAITLVLIGILSAVFYYLYIREKEQPLFTGVPNSAALIIEMKNLTDSWETLNRTETWNSLSKNQSIKELNQRVHRIDSVMSNIDLLSSLLSNSKSAISFHHVGSHIGVFVTAHISNDASWIEAITTFTRQMNWHVTKRNFEHETVIDITDSEKKPVCAVAVKDNLILCASDGVLVEESILKLKYHIKNSVKGLDNLSTLSKSGSDFNLYINYTATAELLAVFLKNEYNKVFSWFSNFANWSLLNVSFDQKLITFKGATITDDSMYQYLDLFSGQNPVISKLDKYLPSSTAYLFKLGFSDYALFKNQLTEYLQQSGQFVEYTKQKDSLETLYDINLGSDFEAMIGDQMIIGSIESASGDAASGQFALLKVRDIQAAKKLLEIYSSRIKQRGIQFDSLHTSENNNRLLFGNFLRLYTGPVANHLQSPYFSFIDDIIVFANNTTVLNQINNDYSNGSVLLNNISYQNFSVQAGETFNLGFFINTSSAYMYPSNFLTEEVYSLMNRNSNDIRKFEMLEINYAASGDKTFYTQISLYHNQDVKDETRILWTLAIDTTLAIKPALIYDPFTAQNQILVQDVKNNLYCITQNGAIKWRTQLSGKILSEINTVYPDETGNPAYLFNTSTQTCLIDANGNNKYGYPVRFSARTDTCITLTINQNDSSAYWYVSLANNRIAAYSLDGKPKKGWQLKPFSAAPASCPLLFNLGDKKYIYTTDKKGNIIILDSLGNLIKHQLPKALQGTFAIFKSIDTGSVQMILPDSSHTLKSVTLNSSWQIINQKIISEWNSLSYTTIYLPTDQRYYYLMFDSIYYSLMDESGTTLFSKPKGGDSTYAPYIFPITTSDGKLFIGIADKKIGQINLIDYKGNSMPSFPLQGNSIFGILNLYEASSKELTSTDKSNKLITYRLK